MIVKSTARLPLVIEPLETLLAQRWLLVLPLAFLESAVIRALPVTKSLLQGHDSLWILFIGTLIVNLVTFVPRVRQSLDSSIEAFKVAVVLSCPAMINRSRGHRWRPSCWIISDGLKQPHLPNSSQEQIVEKIKSDLLSDAAKSPGVFYIEGQSGQGKTQTIFLLLHALLRSSGLSHFADRSFLYDLATGPETQELLADRLGLQPHQGALVFIDNFHKIQPELLRSLTDLILWNSGRAERMFILLGQPRDAWVIHPATEVKLMTYAKEIGFSAQLASMPSSVVSDRIAQEPGGESFRELFGARIHDSASVAQLHFAQAVITSRGNPNFVLGLFRLIEGGDTLQSELRSDMLRCIAIMSALSLFAGSFRKKDFWKAFEETSERTTSTGTLPERIRMWVLCSRIARAGLTLVSPTKAAYRMFHERLAEDCKDTLQSDRLFLHVFRTAVLWRRSENRSDPVISWLLSCEVADVRTAEQAFDGALLQGSLGPMLHCLQRNWPQLSSHPSFAYQYALLLDKSGKFAKSREVFSKFPTADAQNIALAERVQLSRVEAFHGEDSYDTLVLLKDSSNPGNRIAAEYWRIHLDSHKGLFRPEQLLELAKRIGDSFSASELRSSYFLLHTAERIYFDAHRHVYLAGREIVPRLGELAHLPIDAALRERLPQYRGFELLYRQAHFLAHEALPGLIFDAAFSDTAQLPVSFLPVVTSSDLRDVIDQAIGLYKLASDEFATYGDREALYLQADILNLQMLSRDADLPSFELKWKHYQRFIEDAHFPDLFSYPHFYFFRWHMARHYRWLESGNHSIPSDDAELAYSHLIKAGEYDRTCGNLYGRWRIAVLRAILEDTLHMRKGSRPLTSVLADLAKTALDRGYSRDHRLLVWLSRGGKVHFGDIKKFILYYPFVHQ